MKHWHNLFGALGKVITVSASTAPYDTVANFLREIRHSVYDKIKECKTTFNEGRPLVLVGFGHSSLVAAHCALENASNVNATICLGFPLTAINGFRGVCHLIFPHILTDVISNIKDLDDPLLETTVPTLFVIGQNSTMATLDDMEDFRERITKTETGLVVVGGANDRLMISSSKKKFDGITQAMVDRCIADEIYEFVSNVLNPSSAPVQSTTSRGTPNKSTNKSISFMPGVTAIPKPRRKRPSAREKDKDRTPKPKAGRKRSKNELPVPESKTVTPPKPKHLSHIPEAFPSTSTPNTSKPEAPILKPIISIPRLPEQTPPRLEARPSHYTHLTPLELPPHTPDKTKPEDNNTPDSNSTISVGSNDSNGNPMIPRLDSTPPNTTPKSERHYGLSYGISEMPTVISQSATRTGRQIRAPKSLDV